MNNYKELRELIESLRVNQANYQPVVIKSLLGTYPNGIQKEELASILSSNNVSMNKTYSFFMSVPVWQVLGNKGIISIDKDTKVVSLNAVLNHIQVKELLGLVDEKLKISGIKPTNRELIA